MKILFISHSNPFRYSGGSFASRAYLEAFIKLGHDVTLMCADGINAPNFNHRFIGVPARSKIQKYIGLALGEIHRFKSYFAHFWAINHSYYDIVVLNSGILGDLSSIIGRYAKVITIHHNVERDYHSDSKTVESFYGLWSGWINRNERIALLNSDLNLTISEEDRTRFRNLYKLNKSIPIEVLGCFEDPFRKKIEINESPTKEFDIVISGSLGDYQTEIGILEFLKHYRLAETTNLKRFLITGRNPSLKLQHEIERFPQMKLIANPVDIDAEIQKAKVYLCPTFMGSGLKLRLMDGLRNGLPIITHKVSAQGYGMFRDKPYFLIFENFNNLPNIIRDTEFNVSSKLIMEEYRLQFSFESGVNRLRLFMKNINL